MRKALMRTELEFKQEKGVDRSRTFTCGDSRASLLPCSSTKKWCRLKVTVSCLSELLESDKMIGLASVKIRTEEHQSIPAAPASPDKKPMEAMQESPCSVDQHSSIFTARATNNAETSRHSAASPQTDRARDSSRSGSNSSASPGPNDRSVGKNAGGQVTKKAADALHLTQPSQPSSTKQASTEHRKNNSEAGKRLKPSASAESKSQEQDAKSSAKRRNEGKSTNMLPLNGVYISISGIENPNRAQLREQALSLGARYAPQWLSGCTHLICAFPNTPKYREAKKDGGVVVEASWLRDCAREQRKLPTSKYEM